ncbi:MAG TPA: fibrillarin-like rRNA/tRNA 2'-O-methyltransferase [Thermoplasmata archaeon]|nr:fibrillarin-like rRNA/tRNA 2'-O-methyltransferase [Thermoplasmata archaeon]
METSAWPGVFRRGRDLYTANLVPGRRVYGEDLREEGGVEYRQWDPWRSKLAAYLLKSPAPGLLSRARKVLYLGGAHGTTVSHLSDMLPAAEIYVIEKSAASFAPLLALARERPNVLPILADAQLPERYAADVGTVDFLYQDVAQRTQPAIFRENATTCLHAEGEGLLMLKVRSVTQSRPTRAVLAEARRELEGAALRVGDSADLAPFSRDHVALRLSK